jgi:hypothetical protein
MKLTPGPSLNTPMYRPSCGILRWKNPESNQSENVVVAQSGQQVSLLFLNEDTNNNGPQWKVGPQISNPTDLAKATMIEYSNSVILIGGHSGIELPKNLNQLSSPDGPWVEMRQTLKKGRFEPVSFLVPDDLVNCYE